MANDAPRESKVEIYIRMERELHEAVKAAATAEDRSVSSFIRITLRNAMRDSARGKGEE